MLQGFFQAIKRPNDNREPYRPDQDTTTPKFSGEEENHLFYHLSHSTLHHWRLIRSADT
jgi:hypothetical protein